jgi:small-conductance mechanosensitive channel
MLSDRVAETGGWLQTPLFEIGATEITVARLAVVVGVVLATVWVARLARRVTNRHFERRGIEENLEASAAGGVVVLLVYLVGFEIVLLTLGIHLTSLIAAGGAFALAAGFAAKSVIENFISGVILHVGQNIRSGDVIVVKDRLVRVVRVGVRVTNGVTLDGAEILIPNSIVAQSIVNNLTHHDRTSRISCTVGVDYSSDIRLVRSTLESTVADLPWRYPDKESVVFLDEFGDTSLRYSVHVWIDEAEQGLLRSSQLHEAVWFALEGAGIKVAHPRLDVRLDRDFGESRRQSP